MERPDKHSSSQSQAVTKWACRVLEVEQPTSAISQQEVVTAFFKSLESNDFYVPTKKSEAVDLVMGTPAVKSPAFLKHRTRQGLQQLDEVVQWFGDCLGEMPSPELLTALRERLAIENVQDYPEVVQSYAQRIWQTGQAVDRRVVEDNEAVKKLLQSLFHIATVRPSQRCRVRSQWVQDLRREFSVAELTAAIKFVRKNAKTPDGQFHRPFLFMLTREGGELNDCRLAPPVDSRKAAVVHRKQYVYSSTANTSGDRIMGVLIFFAVAVGLVGSLVRSANRMQPRPKPIVPEFTIDPDDEKMMELLRVLFGDKEVDEFQESAEREKEIRERSENESLVPVILPESKPTKDPYSVVPGLPIDPNENRSSRVGR